MRSLALACTLALAACGATSNRVGPERIDLAQDTEPSFTGTLEPAEEVTLPELVDERVIARVAGQPIHADELLQLWLHRESPKVRDYIEELVLGRLVMAEARKLGMELDRQLVDRTAADAVSQLEEELARREAGMGVDEFIRTRLGLEPGVYRARVHHEAEIDLLASRCVRSWLLASERCEVRVIVIEDLAVVAQVQSALDGGEDFASVARRFSSEESAQLGGRIPPVVRTDTLLSRLAFATPVGEVGGPVLEAGSSLFLLCEARPEPVKGDWSAVATAVEHSLDRRGVEDPEYWQWKSAMIQSYAVDMEPFFQLMDEPLD